MKKTICLLFPAILIISGSLSCEKKSPEGNNEYLEHFKPITQKVVENPKNGLTPAKIELGKMLYHDPRLSKSGLFSCNTCHNLGSYGMSNLPTDIGHKWAIGPVNSGTVYNAAFYKAQFWDGRAKDLEEQAKGPILAPVEMGMPSEEAAVKRIISIPQYRTLFEKVFPKDKNAVTYDNIAKAIAAFERTLLTPSRFDKFLLGDRGALNSEEKSGVKLFIEKGCSSCHDGIALGGDFSKMGLVKPYRTDNPSRGRYDVTKNKDDINMFKVTTLRNIERTYPYFHDGKVWELEEAIKIMADVQIGITLTEMEVKKIKAFLISLTGKIPENALKLPVLPPSSKKTPKPSHI
jgi:cytochrome c peroxidase